MFSNIQYNGGIGREPQVVIWIPSHQEKELRQKVPCLRRVSSIEEEYDKDEVDVLLDNDDDGGFLAVPGPRGIHLT
jgi:hypothetical protein